MVKRRCLLAWLPFLVAAAFLLPASARSAVLTSADVSITASPSLFTAYSKTGATPGDSFDSGSYLCGPGSCTTSYSLSASGFELDQVCNTVAVCDFPEVTIELTNMVFSPAQMVSGLSVVETEKGFVDPSGTLYSTAFTTNSVTLTVQAFSVTCGDPQGFVDEAATFETENPVTAIPEPSTLSLMAMGVLGLLMWRCRDKLQAHTR